MPPLFAAQQRRPAWRRYWLNIHLYLGLSVGLVFVLAGLTGSLLVFYVELDEWLNSPLQLAVSEQPSSVQPYEKIIEALKSAHPQRTGAWRLEIPRNAQAPMMARYYKPDEKAHLHFAPLIAWINPYTAEVIRSRFWGEYLMTWIYDLHYTLLLDETGKIVMGILGGFLLVGLGSGVYLWWPAPGKLRSALTLKKAASTPRFIFDVHKLNGIYGFIVLLLLTLSGILLELPDFFNPGIARLSPLYKAPPVASLPQLGKSRISVDKAVAVAQQAFPQALLRWVETPANPLGVYRIQLYQKGEPSIRFPKTTLWLDQYSGAILTIRNPVQQSAGDTFLGWLHPLHSGEIAGLPGRWLVLFSGLVPLLLYVTGVIRWLQKRRAKRLKWALS